VRRVIIQIVIGAAALLALVVFVITTFLRGPAFNLYAGRLDKWVQDGGQIPTAQDQVINNCGKLVMSQAGPLGVLSYMTFDREDFHFRVDVCLKMTVNRVHKQPEFEKPEILREICGGENDLFLRLCRRSGLKP
jgi:hypothetical protein